MAWAPGSPVAVVLADRLVAARKNLVDRLRPAAALQRCSVKTWVDSLVK